MLRKKVLEVGKEISNQLRIINSSGISETTWGIGCLVSATVASNNYTRLPKFTIKSPIASATKFALGAGTVSLLGSSMVYLTLGATKVVKGTIPLLFNVKSNEVVRIKEYHSGKIDIPGINSIDQKLLPKPLQIKGIPSEEIEEEIIMTQNPLHNENPFDLRDEFVEDFLEGDVIDFLIGNIY